MGTVGEDFYQARECAVAFVKEYYLKYAKHPVQLASMYGGCSVLSHNLAGEQCQPASGPDQIAAFLESRAPPVPQDRKVVLEALEAMPSVAGSVFVATKGAIISPIERQEFSQAFLLARHGGQWYVRNDAMQLSASLRNGHGAVAAADEAEGEGQPATAPKRARRHRAGRRHKGRSRKNGAGEGDDIPPDLEEDVELSDDDCDQSPSPPRETRQEVEELREALRAAQEELSAARAEAQSKVRPRGCAAEGGRVPSPGCTAYTRGSLGMAGGRRMVGVFDTDG
eukprot:TRINITY_DN5392_c0_g2_i1.p1 TRINITY_DN5392_c0_g2~~TRINITY_DN5392_c0_g2_i1.p1  ORF type:complete len:282 (+),score=71.76 TRINITY_DN5392_c0_g2_i1:190-1035(+)